MEAALKCTDRKYVCASERIKLIGSIDGMFPDFGHHLENEMGGLWLHPVKLLDGFWMRFCDHTAGTVDRFIIADGFSNKPYGNEFYYGSGLGHTEVRIKQFQYAPEEAAGLIISYEFYNSGRTLRSLTAEFLARTDIRPVWFSEALNIHPGACDKLDYIPEMDAFHAKDSEHEWHVLFGASEKPTGVRSGANLYGPQVTSGKGTGGSLMYDFTLEANSTKLLTFYIAGSSESVEDCMQQYRHLKYDPDLLDLKKQRYERIEETCRLSVEDKRFEEIFQWVKVNNDWLIVRVPGYGRGLSAGLPEYPWWFGCDSCYALQGVLATGNYELCHDTILLLLEYSENFNNNGRILHEVTTFGAVPNPGCTQETAHFITLVWKYYQWTGDWPLVERCIPYLQKSIDWLMKADDDGDLFPSGYGITEIAGLNMEMIDSAVYTCEAYYDWAEICRLKGRKEDHDRFLALAGKLEQAINEKFWNEKEALYCDLIASYDDILKNLDLIFEKTPQLKEKGGAEYINALIGKASEAQGSNKGTAANPIEGTAVDTIEASMGSAERGWLLHKNWVITTPMETGLAPRDKAEKALQRLNTDEFIGEYGMYLSALHHNAIMTISTGVLAVSQARYGHPDRALALIERMFKSFSMAAPGSISEMSPDYGCFVQAWTIYSAAVPIVCHFFGLQPNAPENCIDFMPCMPKAWDKASLQKVRILNGTISIEFSREGSQENYNISNNSGCAIRLKLCEPCNIYLNGSFISTDENTGCLTALDGNGSVTVEIEKSR